MADAFIPQIISQGVVYDPDHPRGCDNGHYSYGWNHRVCKHFGYSDITNGNRAWVQHYDGSYLYSDYSGGDHWHDPSLLTEACRHGNKGYDVWVDNPHACVWKHLKLTY